MEGNEPTARAVWQCAPIAWQRDRRVLPSSIRDEAKRRIATAEGLLSYQFRTVDGRSAVMEAMVHCSVARFPEGNMQLMRMGDGLLTVLNVLRQHNRGNPSGTAVSAQQIEHLTIGNLSRVWPHDRVDALLFTSSGMTITDKMRAHFVQAMLAAVFIDSDFDEFGKVAVFNLGILA